MLRRIKGPSRPDVAEPGCSGHGISLFAGLGQRVDLEGTETSGYAGEAHLRYRVLR